MRMSALFLAVQGALREKKEHWVWMRNLQGEKIPRGAACKVQVKKGRWLEGEI